VFLGAIGYVISYMYLAMKINHDFFFDKCKSRNIDKQRC